MLATFEDRVALVALIFTRGGVTLYPSGRIELTGAVSLEGPLPTGSEPSGASRGALQIPVRLDAWAGRRGELVFESQRRK